MHRGLNRDNSGANDYLRDVRSLARCLVHRMRRRMRGVAHKTPTIRLWLRRARRPVRSRPFFFTVFHLSRLLSSWQQRTCPVLYPLAFLRSLVTGITSTPFSVFDRDGYVRQKKQCSIIKGREKGRERSIDLVRCNCFGIYQSFVELLRD